ncbi:3-hydroxyacyl-[acyl-carrier-protein] dehydratase FabZ [Lysobacter sp. TY2-98]|uniref:3-hydroxyacyl-ACP dehydratase FabZ n=1 Tax=Lysobacter sp. TY2-98 TaxID=2290922 RepID=UPI000E20268E|nr:3-hydroxyacyl-ACP dehydratase FabZ [Lysobacter sp. TY2-98]AXK71576.1 3-hydroxyacyl-[acyl-carrier-protein] dehydratase FabZ [Lysobacter sp. TY2-98]
MNQTVQLPVDVRGIEALLPHRYPFLLVDRVVAFEPRKRILAYKNVTANEPCFTGHFPGNPVMPGVLIIEALAQAGGLLTTLTAKSEGAGPQDEKLFYLVKVDGAKFMKQVVPGDRIELDVELKRVIRNMAMYAGVARVDGEVVACAEILCAEAQR